VGDLHYGDYALLEDLATKGKAVLNVTLNEHGKITFSKAETLEDDLAQAQTQVIDLEKELEDAQNELKKANKTIQQLEKKVKSLETQAEKKVAPKKSKTVEDWPE
jgi:chromosome segregation ATPase